MATVLVIHQDPLAVDYLAEVLGAAGYQSVGARSAREAMVLLSKQRVDVVLLDADSVSKSAPGLLNFLALAPVLEAAGSRPVILSTESLRQSAHEKAEQRFADIIWKPIEAADLIASVRALVPPR